MKIAVISDIHDNLSTLNIFFELIAKETEENKIENIICCGDVTNEKTLKELSLKFTKTIYLIKGNGEIYQEENLEKYKNIKYLGRYNTIELGNFKIGICHEPIFIKTLLEKEKNLNFIFYGHTHKPWLSMKNKATIINPGTLGGVFQKSSFAIWDSNNGKIKLKLLH
jgi:hypothetical protein